MFCILSLRRSDGRGQALPPCLLGSIDRGAQSILFEEMTGWDQTVDFLEPLGKVFHFE
jgi:hypothetical protein